MSYINDKGKNYERFVADEINKYFKDLCGSKFRRTPSQERWKWVNRGDTNCEKKTFCGEDCILNEFHFEVTDRKGLQIIGKWLKTQDDAENRKPLLVWKKTGKAEGVVIKLKDLLSLLYEVMESRKTT